MSADAKKPNKAEEMPLPGGDFLLFLQSLAAQTTIHLGAMAHPETGKTAVDLRMAQYFIDLLDMMEKKTKGNRTGEEDKYMDDVISQLRLAFVEVSKQQKSGS